MDRCKWLVIDVGIFLDTSASHSDFFLFSTFFGAGWGTTWPVQRYQNCVLFLHFSGRGHMYMSSIRSSKNVEKKFSEWLANASKITPTSITTHFHLSKSSHLPYMKKSKIRYFHFCYFFLREGQFIRFPYHAPYKGCMG